MARPYWSGTIQISLVGFAVEIYPATSTTRPISFHEIDRNTMGRVHRQNVAAGPAHFNDADPAEPDEDDTAAKHQTSLHLAPKSNGKASSGQSASHTAEHTVEKSDIVKGFEYEKGKYAIVEPAELKNLRLAGKKTVEISQFSKAAEIDPALYEKPYFVLPKAGPQATAFAVVRQAMIASGMVGVGEIVFSGRQHLMTLSPPHDPEQPGMMLYTLRFATELRHAEDYAKDTQHVHADEAQLKLAKQLIDSYTQPFELSNFKDHYEDALRELVEAKINHLPVPAAEPEKKAGKVIDLMEALRRSLAQHGHAPADGEPSREPPKNTSTASGRAKTAGAAKAASAKKHKSA